MTGEQGTLFRLGAELLEQPELFPDPGGPALPISAPRSWHAEQAAEDAAAPVVDAARVRRQREVMAARYADVRTHRLECGNCIPGARQCKDGRKAEKEARIARDVLRGLLAGEL